MEMSVSRYMREARFHEEKITYFHSYAGSLGYQQAEYHFNRLCSLPERASRSKNDKADVPVLLDMMRDARKLMEEMRSRRDN